MSRFRTNILESNDFPGFYKHPIYDYLVISTDGVVIDTRDAVCLIHHVGFWPYPKVRSRGKDYLVHRLLAETFLKCPGDRRTLIVNHIDGDKTNFKLNNLEWITSSENIIHAFKEGLRTDNKPIEIKNLDTDEIETYYALNELARVLEVNPSVLSIYMKSARKAPFMNIYSIRYVEEPWPELTKDDIGVHRNGLSKNLIVLMHDGGKRIYESVGAAARDLGVKAHMFYSYLNHGTVKSVATSSIKDIMFLSDYKQTIIDAEHIKLEKGEKYIPKRTPIPIRVTNMLTGDIKVWESAAMFAEKHNVLRNTLQKNISERGRWREFKFEYLK